MQFLKVQGYRFYILITYIVIVILFGIEEMINYRTNLDCSKEYRFIFMGIEFLEALIGVISIFGILFLIQELNTSRNEILEAENLITDLKNKKKLSLSYTNSFWEDTQSQFQKWQLTSSEKQIATLLLRGFTNSQIAALRSKSIKTIENQMFSIFQKSSTTGKLDFISYFISPLLPEED